MKYLLLALIAFSSSLFCMQPAPEDLQKIKAASLHNRSQCPLAKLPKDVQDLISEYLEFNDRESDEEFRKNILKIKPQGSHLLGFPIRGISDEVRTKFAGRKTPQYDFTNCPPPQAEREFIALLKPHEHHCSFVSSWPEVKILYSRDKSKIVMERYFRSTTDTATYFFAYDLCENKIIYSQFSDYGYCDDFEIIKAISNDGKFFLIRKTDRMDGSTSYVIASEGKKNGIRAYREPHYFGFNKQSTKYIDTYNNMLLCSEQEHQQRSKKTLALYLHQKGICKPFNYRQESA